MQISFWSNMHGQAGTSSVTAALASTIAQKTAYKTLVAHNHIEKSAVESYFFKRAAQEQNVPGLANQGLDALVRLMRNGRLKPEMVADYTYSLLKNNRLDILLGSSKKERMTKEDEAALMNILKCAGEFYDVILLDVHSGLYESNSINILKNSDIIIFCISQNRFLLEDFTNIISENPFLKQKRSCYAVSRYDKQLSMTAGNLCRKYGLNRRALFEIPNNTRFSDALNSGRVFDFIAYYQNAGECEEKALINSLNHLCEYVIEGCEKP